MLPTTAAQPAPRDRVCTARPARRPQHHADGTKPHGVSRTELLSSFHGALSSRESFPRALPVPAFRGHCANGCVSDTQSHHLGETKQKPGLLRTRNPAILLPRDPVPYTRAGFSSLSARAYLAAATIFIDLVIFWMFLIDFSRLVTEK